MISSKTQQQQAKQFIQFNAFFTLKFADSACHPKVLQFTAMKSSLLFLTLGATTAYGQVISSDQSLVYHDYGSQIWYTNCNLSTYYSGFPSSVSSWTRDQVHALLKSTHRNVLENTNLTLAGVGDVWAALMDMDRGSSPETVHEIYRNIDVPALPFGVRTWDKEYIFPDGRGVGFNGTDWTDIHNIRVVDSFVQFVRGNRYFGLCGHLVRQDTCEAPAEGAANDTCQCNRLFEPPAASNGSIARALMYMDVRYDGTEPKTLNLSLTDCPFDPSRDMAYLSQMLTWHFQYPPDAAELYRNNRACERWQGNRNPFIDYPELATTIFGQPAPLPAAGTALIYPHCADVPTEAPTFTPNTCEGYNPGDFYFFLMNSFEPDNVGIVTLQDLPPGFALYLTNNAWNGTQFLSDRGVLQVRFLLKHRWLSI